MLFRSTIEQPEIPEQFNMTQANMTQPIPFNFDEEAPQIITSESVKYILTEQEKKILSDELSDVVKTTRSEIFNDRLIRRYELGNAWVEYSYNPNSSSEELQYQISLDRMKWLKDLAQQLINKKIKEKIPIQIVENFSI